MINDYCNSNQRINDVESFVKVVYLTQHLAVSSANINVLDELMTVGRSFIYTRKSRGPSILP